MTVIDDLFAALTSSTFDFEQFRYSEFAARLYPVLISIPVTLSFFNISTPLDASAALAQLTAAIAATSDDRILPIIDSIKKILKKIKDDPQIPEDIKNNLNAELTSLEKSIYDYIYSQLTPEQLQQLIFLQQELPLEPELQLEKLQQLLKEKLQQLPFLQPELQILQPELLQLQKVLKERLQKLQQQLQVLQQQLQQQLLWRIQTQLQYERFLPLINELITTLNQ